MDMFSHKGGGKLVLGIGGFITLIVASSSVFFSIIGLHRVSLLLSIITVVGIVTCLAYAVYALLMPLSKTEAYLAEIEEKRIAPLMGGITQIFVGNLTASVPETGLRDGASSASGLLSGLGKRFEKIERTILEGIRDYNGITADPLNRICFVGDNAFQEGVIAAREAGRILGGRGQAAVILTKFKDVNHALRAKGFVNTLRDEFPAVAIKAVTENDTSLGMRQQTETTVRSYLRDFPDLGVIFMTEGYSPVVAAKIIAAHPGKKPKIVTFDIWEENLEGMDLGVIEVLLEQNAYRQGYDPLIYLYNYLEHGVKPAFPKITLRPVVVTRENLSQYWSRAEKKRIFTDEEKSNLARPLPRKGSATIRLGFVCADKENFWRGILEGAEDAASALRSIGVETVVESVYDVKAGHAWGAATHFVPHLERMAADGFKGIAVNISDPALSSTINEVARRGVAFATFNGEPFNFREIIQSIYGGLSSLIAHSETLASAAVESSRSTVMIDATMKKIAEGSDVQGSEVEKTEGLMRSLSQSIAEANEAMTSMNRAMRDATEQSDKGGKAIVDSVAVTQDLRESYGTLEEKVSDLRDKMEKIGAIVEMIEGFAETTNVLAINAFIQAARAGEKGKGFSVVAGAVRGLAENSRKAATDIKTIVEAARDSMEEARISVASGNETVGNNFALASLARDALASVHESSQSAEAAIHAIDGRLKSIESTGREVRDAMSKLREIIEGNGLQVSEISLSTEEMSVQEGELSRTASELLSMARDQEILLTQLTIEREG